MMTDELKCEAGCKVFYGGERKHHKDCVFYPDSFSEMHDALVKERDELRKANDSYTYIKRDGTPVLARDLEAKITTIRQQTIDECVEIAKSYCDKWGNANGFHNQAVAARIISQVIRELGEKK